MRGLIAALALLPTMVAAQVYKCTDAQGRVNLTDQPCGVREGAVLLSAQPQTGAPHMDTAEERHAFEQKMLERADKREAALSAERMRFYNRRSHAGVRIGMSSQDVYSLPDWGYPDDKNTTQTARGNREQWIYSADPNDEFERMYLYFDNDILTVIQD